MSKRAQKIVVLIVALVLVLPLGAVGVSSFFDSAPGTTDPAASSATNPIDPNVDKREVVDPAEQPAPSPTTVAAAPANLTAHDAQGAEATARYLLDSYAYMMATADTKIWRQLVSTDCRICLTFMQQSEALKNQGGYQVGGEFVLGQAETKLSGADTAKVTLDFDEAAAKLVDNPKLEALENPPVSGKILVSLKWVDNRWQVTDLELAPTAPAASTAPADK